MVTIKQNTSNCGIIMDYQNKQS